MIVLATLCSTQYSFTIVAFRSLVDGGDLTTIVQTMDSKAKTTGVSPELSRSAFESGVGI